MKTIHLSLNNNGLNTSPEDIYVWMRQIVGMTSHSIWSCYPMEPWVYIVNIRGVMVSPYCVSAMISIKTPMNTEASPIRIIHRSLRRHTMRSRNFNLISMIDWSANGTRRKRTTIDSSRIFTWRSSKKRFSAKICWRNQHLVRMRSCSWPFKWHISNYTIDSSRPTNRVRRRCINMVGQKPFVPWRKKAKHSLRVFRAQLIPCWRKICWRNARTNISNWSKRRRLDMDSIGIYSPWNISKKSRTKKGNYIAFTRTVRINWWTTQFSLRPLLLRNTSLPEVSVQSWTMDSALVIWLRTSNVGCWSPRIWRMNCQLSCKQPRKVFTNSLRLFEVDIALKSISSLRRLPLAVLEIWCHPIQSILDIDEYLFYVSIVNKLF